VRPAGCTVGWLIAAACLVSCTFDPRVPQGRLICSNKTDCPPGLGFCVTPPGGSNTVCCRNQTCTERDVERTDASDTAQAADASDTPLAGDVGNTSIDAPVDMSLPPTMAIDASGPTDASSDGDASRKGQGVACTANDECLSGYCTDGLCCDVACKGQCQSCAVVDRLGICVPILGPPWMRPACAGDGPCQGMCNGMNTESCSYPELATECAPARCGSDMATPAGRCNGMGSCGIPDPVSCGGKGCDGVACFGGCSAQTPCPPDRFCQAGRCVTKLENSRVCTDSAQCSSGQCVQGVCCDSACTDTCASCLQPGRVGMCSPREPTVVCRPAVGPCDSPENCTGNAVACPADTYLGAGQVCEPASCDGALFTPARTCSGTGAACPLSQKVGCGIYACTTTGCRTSCTSDSDCQLGFYCVGSLCTPKKADRSSCMNNNECSSMMCRTFFRDADGDGHGASEARFCTAAPTGYVTTNDADCCDTDERVYRCRNGMPCNNTPRPGRNVCGNWDYNCDGTETKDPMVIVEAADCGCVGCELDCDQRGTCGCATSRTIMRALPQCGSSYFFQTCPSDTAGFCRLVPEMDIVRCY
jgi:hypothetical protein